MARPKRFELLTPRFVVWCSIQLSYGRLFREQTESLDAISLNDIKAPDLVAKAVAGTPATAKAAKGQQVLPEKANRGAKVFGVTGPSRSKNGVASLAYVPVTSIRDALRP